MEKRAKKNTENPVNTSLSAIKCFFLKKNIIFAIVKQLNLNFTIMNKSQLVDAMAKDAGISKSAAKKALESFLHNVEGTLKKGDKVALIGFGTFSVQARKSRSGHNPATGKKITIPAKKVVKFKAGSGLAKSVN